MTTFVHKNNISLNTSYNDKYFRQSCRENQRKPFIVNNVYQIVPFIGLCGKTWYVRTGNRWQYSTAHALWMLDKKPRLQTNTKKCNTYCFSTETIVTRTYLNITFMCTLLPLY